MKYLELLKSAAKIVWHHKYLWFFGIFAALLSNGEIYKISTGETSDFFASWRKLQATGIFDSSIFPQIINFAQYDPWGLLWRLLILLAVAVLAVFIVWLAIVSQGALVNNIAKINLDKKTDFADGFRCGRVNLWLVFFFKLLEKAVVLALILLTLLPILAVFNYSGNIWPRLLYLLISFLLIVAAAVFALGIKYGVAYGIIRSLRFIEALRSGFQLLMKNWLVSCEAGIVIFVINFLLGAIIVALISATAIPFVFLMFVFYKAAWAWAVTAVLFVGALALFILVAAAGGALWVFNESFWTLTFLQISQGKMNSWLKGLFVRKKV
jgi:hypothetical protein